ncbi:LrgB family protein [Insolitispirillum peregrinum]|uniref:LrgB family protein n=1 Tax=Insolitispirillum peregrinum TaxID=80876 RepID=UPI003617BB14
MTPHLPNDQAVTQLWVYLQASSLWWLMATLLAYAIGVALHAAARKNPLVNPVGIAATLIVCLLLLTDTSYERYFSGAQFVHFLLGPATVALAIPLYHNRDRVRQALIPMTVALLVGSLTGAVSVVAIAAVLGASRETLLSLASKSVTSPIAMAITEQIGGIPSLTAAMVILTGVIGAMIASPLLTALRLKDPLAGGVAVGVAAHGIGTARAFQISPLMGTFAGIAMGLNGLLTAILVPLLFSITQK